MELAAPPHSSSDEDELGALLEAEFADDDQGQPLHEAPLAAQEQTEPNKRRRLNGSGELGRYPFGGPAKASSGSTKKASDGVARAAVYCSTSATKLGSC